MPKQLVQVGRKIVIFGGIDPNEVDVLNVDAFDIDAGEWTRMEFPSWVEASDCVTAAALTDNGCLLFSSSKASAGQLVSVGKYNMNGTGSHEKLLIDIQPGEVEDLVSVGDNRAVLFMDRGQGTDVNCFDCHLIDIGAGRVGVSSLPPLLIDSGFLIDVTVAGNLLVAIHSHQRDPMAYNFHHKILVLDLDCPVAGWHIIDGVQFDFEMGNCLFTPFHVH